MTKPAFLLLVLILVSLKDAYAQDTSDENINDKGFYIGASLMGTGFEIPDVYDDRDSGGGVGLEAGYNFSTNFAIFLSLDGSSMNSDEDESYGLAHFDLGVEGRLGNYDSKFRPYGKASFLGAAATNEIEGEDVEISGTGFGLGAGLYYFVSSNFAFELGYTHSWININEIKAGAVSVEIDENARSGRLALGFSYHF